MRLPGGQGFDMRGNFAGFWIALTAAAAIATHPSVRNAIAAANDSARETSLRLQLCVDLRAVGEKLPGTNCEPNPLPLYPAPF